MQNVILIEGKLKPDMLDCNYEQASTHRIVLLESSDLKNAQYD